MSARLKQLRARLDALEPRRWWFFPPVVLAAAVVAATVALSSGTERSAEPDPAVPVRVMIANRQPVVPTFTSFGEVRPRREWQAVAQVPGKIAWRHPELQAGASFAAGTRLLEIEPLDYEVAESRAGAQLETALAAQAEVTSREADLARSIDIEERSLALSHTRYQRNVDLSKEGHVSALALDAEERELLRQEQTLQNLRTEANLLPAQQKAAAARVAEARAALEKAREDLNRTTFAMPFDGRIVRFDAESGQFVPAGRTMLEAADTHSVEVLLEVPYEHLVTRFPTIMRSRAAMAAPGAAIAADIRYRTTTGNLYWRGHVNRIDTGLSPTSRSVSVYVHVELQPGEIAPAANLYVEVQLAGPELEDLVVIPRLAWHEGTVLIAGSDNRLERREVTVAFAEDERLALAAGVEDGERIILTDLLFPAEGMAVSPVVVDETAAL